MEYITDLRDYNSDRPCVVTLGKFDGVHRGHRKLIRRVHALARQHGWKAAVFTFSVSPQVKMGMRPMQMLMTNAERRALLREMDVELMAECPFTQTLRSMKAEDFVRELLLARLRTKAVIVGTDFRFGKDRLGTPRLMKEMGEKLGFAVEIIPKEQFGNRDISSSYIREEISEGRMEKAEELLGYPYFVSGEIVHGRHLGHSLGFPTINQIPEPQKLLPPRGVYVSRTLVAGKKMEGVTNIGVRPTVSGSSLSVETYLFDCSMDLYGQDARVELLSWRRPEKRFDSLESLQTAIDSDIQDADQWFGKKKQARAAVSGKTEVRD